MYSSGPQILLVEDDSAEAQLIQDVFTRARIGNPFICVNSAEEALKYILGEGKYSDRLKFPVPCLVLLDLKLAGMSGLDLLKAVKAIPDYKRLPFVVLTHSSSVNDMRLAYENGASSYLVKPVNLQEFREMLKTVNAYWTIHSQKPVF